MISLRLIFISFISIPCLSYAELLTDPTMPASYRNTSNSSPDKTVSAQQWVLDSTIISPSQKLAVINGKTLEIGEEINGAKLKSIEHQQVKLSINNKIITLSLHQSFISHIK